MAATVAEFFASSNTPKRRQVYAWKKLRAVLESKIAGGSRYHQRSHTLGMSATLSVEVEEQLILWINEPRADGVPVTSMVLKLQAQDLHRTSGPCVELVKASWSWQKHFLSRHKLSIRHRTLEVQSTPADAEQKTEEVSKQVWLKMQKLGVSVVYNTDQSGVNHEYMRLLLQSPRAEPRMAG
ncbi:hypothetical protein JG688_00011845 [Phytophthora aleatoria]|uniref:HTH CENPB-type domain-containing protein n=1 Tax=Phytophthora aleatoria TaxID=2496075 RepID=A0A8J5J3H3_9STRA|nr:hypothetical protein JG688_00011845 [Phytophthora aleatoria]